MTKPIDRGPIYRRRSFDREITELCVRWYVTHKLSYRDLVAFRSPVRTTSTAAATGQAGSGC